MHGDNVRITFNEIAEIFAAYCILRLEHSVQNVALVIDLRFRRVDVFRLILFLCKYARAERYNFTGNSVHGKDHTSTETVIDPETIGFVLFFLDDQTSFLHHLQAIAILLSLFTKVIPLIDAIPKLELFNYAIIKT